VAPLDSLGPKETWLRLLLIDAGFPKPSTQIPIVENYRTLAVLDMGWREFGVAVEYDGDHHRSDRHQYAKDQWRLRKLAELGWIVIRVIAEDRPEEVIERVRRALLARAWSERATAFVLVG
jgi:very-short-patch-repair endonuclease